MSGAYADWSRICRFYGMALAARSMADGCLIPRLLRAGAREAVDLAEWYAALAVYEASERRAKGVA